MAMQAPVVLAGVAAAFIAGLTARISPSSQSSQPMPSSQSSRPASQPASQSIDHVIVIGCVSANDDSFVLTTSTSASAAAHLRHGSNSPKASTPVASGDTAGPARDDASGTSGAEKTAAGSNSAKASIPVPAASSTSTGQRTHVVMSAKGSVPIGGRASSELRYKLEGDRDQLSTYRGQMVQISGRILAVPSADSIGSLKVEQAKVLPSACTQ